MLRILTTGRKERDRLIIIVNIIASSLIEISKMKWLEIKNQYGLKKFHYHPRLKQNELSE